MICPNCESELKEVVKGGFSCPNCNPNKTNKSNRKIQVILVLAIIIVLIFIVSIVVVSIKISNDNNIFEKAKNNANLMNDSNDESNNYEEVNTSKFNNDIIKERFKNSYNYLIEDINDHNTNVVTRNQQRQILQVPQVGVVSALYDRKQKNMVFIEYYGKSVGTEILWIDIKEKSPYSIFEGYSEETVMRPYYIKAVNINGLIIDQRSNNTEYTTFLPTIHLLRDGSNNEDVKNIRDRYVLKEFEWIFNSNNELTFNEI